MTSRARAAYDPDCRLCPRLVSYLHASRARYPHYWCRPVGPFGDPAPGILLVGLAPGLHGANRTGRPFTGDFAGILLYRTLFELGLASHPEGASPDDGLKLKGVRITNAVKCAPPQNKPTPDEIRRCNPYLKEELEALASVRVLIALGRIAHEAILAALALKRSAFGFGHGREHALAGGRVLIDSYHCSRYNTQTGRLTAAMFKSVLARGQALAEAPARSRS